MAVADIDGYVAAGFDGVREAFAANFDSHGEVGASFCLYHRGEKVVDLWGGVADPATGRRYEEDTCQLVFSTTKGIVAIAANQLIDAGRLDPDAPVATYWPEFAQAGKDELPVRWLLCHKAGLPVLDVNLTVDETLSWDPVVEALAAQAPIWEPGTQHGYHATTFGWLVGELIRRVSGQGVGAYVAENIAGPLGVDLWIGVPEDRLGQVAPLVPIDLPDNENVRMIIEQVLGPDSITGKALRTPCPELFGGTEGMIDLSMFDDPRVLQAEIPAANGVTNARALARVYAATIGEVDGIRLLSEAQVDKAIERQTTGPDAVMFFETALGLGFFLSSAFSSYGGPRGFGHTGTGGSMGFADPDAGIGYGYVMNHLMPNMIGDARTVGLTEACYEAIGGRPPVIL
ncbi:MAG: beta-lactamase family protein [Acidimicrobiales bacterium]|nr:beta-lactamase family protein [Acidimicrobiales bacterium]